MPLDFDYQYVALWEPGDPPPDLFAFLTQCGDLNPAQQLAVLLADQPRRWQTEQALTVEDYLARLPDLAEDPDVKLQLAIGEFRARQSSDAPPSIDEFTSRFADISDALRGKLSERLSSDNAKERSKFTTTQTYISDSIVGDQQIGRYRLIRVLGEGGFGRVYLGFDEELQRQVAIKVPTAERFQKPEDAEAYLAEARTVAGLDHPHIVPVHDMGRTDDGSIYVVSKFIEGRTLGDRIKTDRPNHDETARLLATVAGALHHAHERRLIHRDVKPANILIEETTETPYVADFGLAIREEDYLKDSKIAGTPAYMSPEQARGEGHRLDRRSDIFSLGVMFYELLTGKRPFRGSTNNELLYQVVCVDPPHPRQLDDTIPAELERICMKALCKRASDRYASAGEFADDLSHWQQGPEQEQKELTIVPKGLRSFDADDADFFLELLPGPRDRDGLPALIHFWKTRIEQTDPDRTFPVGLIYGPSGSGKSSLVQAGLLPRLSNVVLPVYVEATAHETELRILKEIRKRCSAVPHDLTLPEVFARLREGSWVPRGQKIVIVIDQFEQWLFVTQLQEESRLVEALRHCDGARVQCVVMVRDDFWMAATRFMQALEIDLIQGHNLSAVDRFDLRHAKRVLTLFGQAYGALPQDSGELTRYQHAFLDQSVRTLAEDGRVVCVRLALFADMIKASVWTSNTLKSAGGSEGIGVAFLDETFGSPGANPKHRLHERAAQKILNELLPPAGVDIRGHMKSRALLLEASGYAGRRGNFDELLRILDPELRLITPTDPGHGQIDGADSGAPAKQTSYQLTHDYLVPSLRRWLTRKQKETRRGRAELTLAERTSLWSGKHQKRYLPSGWEWVCIALLTNWRHGLAPQRNMMRAAAKYYSLRIAAAIVIALLIGWATYETIGHTKAATLVQKLRTAEIREVPEIVRTIGPLRRWANSLLRSSYASAPARSREKLNAGLGLLPVDHTMIEGLVGRMLRAEPVTLLVIRDALRPHRLDVCDELWSLVDGEDDPARRFRAAVALAAFAPGEDVDARWKNHADLIADQLLVEVVANLNHYAPLTEALRPIRLHLIPPLQYEFRSPEPSYRRSMATNILADFARHAPETLAELAMDADAAQFRFLFPRIARFEDRTIEAFSNEISNRTSHDAADTEEEAAAKRQANAAVGLYRFGRYEWIWTTLRQRPDPRLRAYVIHRLQPFGAEPSALAAAITVEQEVPVLQAILLALGEFSANEIGREQLQVVVPKLAEMFQTHEDAGIHSASQWLLETWGHGDAVERVEELGANGQFSAGNWSITAESHTMVTVDGREEPGVGRKFEIATKEVTVAQFQRLFPQYQPYLEKSPTRDCPANIVSWYDAVAYCRRLSEVNGIPEDQICFPPLDEGQEELQPYPDYLSRTGYRLPTEAEWQLACRADTNTKFFFGESHELLPEYAWFEENSGHRLSPVGGKKPSDLGLFDMYGNALEWCDDMAGTDRALRGGSASFRAESISSWGRGTYAPTTRYYSNGFRVARTCISASEAEVRSQVPD